MLMRQAASDDEVAILSKILFYSSSGTFPDGGAQGNVCVETVCEENVNWDFCFDLGPAH